MKVTHLVVFLPPALGAYVLSQHRTKVSSSLSSADDVSMQDEPHTLRINLWNCIGSELVFRLEFGFSC